MRIVLAVKTIRSSLKAIQELGAEYIRQCFDYDPKTGTITWGNRPESHFVNSTYRNRYYSLHFGKPLSTKTPYQGYPAASVRKDTVVYSLQQRHIAWLLMGGDFPLGMDVGHADGDPLNLMGDNLILVPYTDKQKKKPSKKKEQNVSKEVFEELGLEFLRECFDVDFQTGEVKWKQRPREHFDSNRSYGIHIGKVAGRPLRVPKRKKDKITIRLVAKGKVYSFYAHYLIWYLAGRTVKNGNVLDHVNRQGADNRLSNLRECSVSENVRNKSVLRNNKSGVTGVYAERGKWVAHITLGTFDTLEEAAAARRKAELDSYGAYAPNATTDPEFLSRTAGTLAGLI